MLRSSEMRLAHHGRAEARVHARYGHGQGLRQRRETRRPVLLCRCHENFRPLEERMDGHSCSHARPRGRVERYGREERALSTARVRKQHRPQRMKNLRLHPRETLDGQDGVQSHFPCRLASVDYHGTSELVGGRVIRVASHAVGRAPIGGVAIGSFLPHPFLLPLARLPQASVGRGLAQKDFHKNLCELWKKSPAAHRRKFCADLGGGGARRGDLQQHDLQRPQTAGDQLRCLLRQPLRARGLHLLQHPHGKLKVDGDHHEHLLWHILQELPLAHHRASNQG
mmetsp:Transcript_43899/g.138575  ORF Transcript_43899/g.138575 Transcript_43899/m.138575 type:complete len:282 (-) Transcript_43899:688-1533(-)